MVHAGFQVSKKKFQIQIDINQIVSNVIGYKSMFAYVYGPVCFLILSDVVFFVMTTILIRRAGIGSSNRHSKEKYRSVLSHK